MARWIFRGWKRLRARQLRRCSTVGERLAWEILRSRRCLGLKSRRQHRVRGFVLDFYCAELRLAVGVDGTIHETQGQAEYDAFRDRALANQGIATIRITNSAVSRLRLTSLINEFLKARPPSPPRGEGVRG